MKERFFVFIVLIVLASTVAPYFPLNTPLSSESVFCRESGSALQTEKKPRQDYMKKVLSRNLRPLGLKESKALNKLLGQSHLKWVIRSEKRHILN